MEAARTDSTGLVPVPERSTQFFRESSRIGIEGSQLMNVARDVHIHQQPTAVVHRPPAETITTTGDTQYTPSGCYCNQMLFQGRGFPLYVPAPRGNLPAEYARQGVSIGDVGRVTPEGVFDFFFNIYLPADHPINDNDVPDNFTPLTGYDSKSVLPLDYLPEDFVSTPDSVRRMDLPSQQEFEDFLLEGSGSRGAVLAMPFGSRVEKLGNSLEQMVEYARANAESWYQHSNGTRGRRLSNGSLYLITGWEKARAWGMASFQNAAAQSPFRLAFQPVFDSNTGAYKYRWTASGPARTRTSGQIPADDAPLNQTVFIHGFSISLGTGIWGKLFKGVDISELVDSRAAQANQDYIPFGSQGFSFSWAFGFLAGGGSSGGKPHGREDPASTDAVKISDIAPVQNFVHPSAVINNYMLQKFPDAAVVMSHDNDWRDILRVDNTDQDPVSLLKSACEGFSLEEWNGLITIRRSRDKSEEDVAMVSPSEDIRGVESSSGAENDMDYQEDTQPELACICWPRGPCLCGGLRHSITLTLELHEDSQLEDLPFEMTAPTGAEGLYKAATADNSEDMDMEVAPPDLLPRSGDAPLACLFCRDRKIACGPPIGGASQVGCNQCQRRGLKCEYPMESLRGMRKKRKEQEKIPASVACLPCRTRRINCDGASPCHSCERLGIGSTCNYDSPIPKTHHGLDPDETPNVTRLGVHKGSYGTQAYPPGGDNLAKSLRKFTSAHAPLLGWAGFQALQLKRIPANVRQNALLVELTPSDHHESHRRFSVAATHVVPRTYICDPLVIADIQRREQRCRANGGIGTAVIIIQCGGVSQVMPVEVDSPSKIAWDSRDDWALVLHHFVESGGTDFQPISTTSRGVYYGY